MNCNETIIIGLNEISKAINHMVLLNKIVNIHLVINNTTVTHVHYVLYQMPTEQWRSQDVFIGVTREGCK